MLTRILLVGAIVAAAGLLQAVTLASSPQLNIITPRGVQRGGEHVLTFSGARLSDPLEVLLYDPAGIDVVQIEAVDASTVQVTISVDEDCRLGEHVVHLRTRRGITEYRSFYVGALPTVEEVEPNNSPESAQRIERNVTVTGTITNEDVDYFVVAATAGQRLSVEIEGMRLGSAMFDPYLAVLDQDQNELAICDDHPLVGQDAFCSLIVPQDGDYWIMVREASYGGGNGFWYRLHVGDFPRPTAVFPPGGTSDEQLDVAFLGDPAGEMIRQVTPTGERLFRGGLHAEDDFGISPSPVPFRIVALENILEQEGGASGDNPQEITLPAAINGIIGTEGEIDVYQFPASAGEVWDFDCYARRVGSGLDSVIEIRNAGGNVVGSDDDGRRPDSYLRFQVPEDGTYTLRVRDHLRRGQPDFVYRVEISRPSGRLSLGIPRVDRFSQSRQQIAVPRGGRFATLVSAERSDFAGPIELIGDALPPGIAMHSRQMPPGMNVMPVVFEAAEDAPLGGGLIDFRGRHAEDDSQIEGGFVNQADFVLGPPNNAVFYRCEVDRLAVAVVDQLPFELQLVQPSVPVVRGGTLNLKVVATRAEGFTAPITLEFPFRPPGIGTTNQVVMAEGESEAQYPLNAAANAPISQWPIYVIGRADVEGPAWTATQLIELQVAEPYVTAELPRVAGQPGETIQMVAPLTHAQSFDGEATAELLSLPPGTSSAAVQFTSESESVTFSIETTAEAPLGKHRPILCRISIPQGEEQIVANGGEAELQLVPPPPNITPAAAANEPPPTAEPPSERPLTRLEQLRQQARQRSGGGG